MAQLISVRLSRHDSQPLGFRLQGGKDFGTPLVIQKVNGGSPAERAGLLAGDAVIKVNNTDVYSLRHKEAQDAIIAAGQNIELTIQRGGGTWRPSVSNIGTLPTPSGRSFGQVSPVTKTSLRATPQQSQAFGSGHNNVAKPFNYMNGSGDSTVKSIVNRQYNTPVGMYSEETIAETLSAQAEVLAGGVLGVNFKKNEKHYDAEKSEVFKMLQEADNDPEPEAPRSPAPTSGLRHVIAPTTRPDAPINNTGGLPPGQNICEECERLIVGVFVRIKDKNLHVECFKCATCGTSLKNQGYYNLNGKLYCDIHAKLIARQNPPAPNLEPVTLSPGGKFPASAITSALANHTIPLPPLSTNNIGNGLSPYSPLSSNLSGPRPFGGPGAPQQTPSLASTLSPRSAPMSPAHRAVPPPAPPTSYPIHAPVTPVKGLKSVVWPPKNPPEEQPPQSEPVCAPGAKQNPQESTSPCPRTQPAPTMPAPWLLKESRSDPDSHKVQVGSDAAVMERYNAQAQSTTAEVCSMMKRGSVSMSSFSESQASQISETVSIAQQQSSEASSFTHKTIYQSQTSIPIQKTYDVEDTQSQQRKQSICTAEVSNINESNVKTIDSVKTITESVDNQVLIDEIKRDNTPRPPSPTPEDTTPPSNGDNEKTSIETEAVAYKETENVASDETVQASECKRTSISSEVKTERKDSTTSETKRLSITSSTVSEVKQTDLAPPYKPLPPTNILNSIPKCYESPMTYALTIAPDRPYSPLPQVTQIECANVESIASTAVSTSASMTETKVTTSKFSYQPPNRGFSPIPPVRPYTPSDKPAEPISMPEDTKPYIPPDIPFTIEPKNARDGAESPFVDALTVAPDRPFTPLGIQPLPPRGSLLEALTVAPDRPYSPLVMSQDYPSTCVKPIVSEPAPNNDMVCVRPVAKQASQFETSSVCSSNVCVRSVASQPSQIVQNSNMQPNSSAPLQLNASCKLQSSTQTSAFTPVVKTVQTFPPPQPEEFAQPHPSFPPVSDQLKSAYGSSFKSVSASSKSVTSSSMTASSVNASSMTASSVNASSMTSSNNVFESCQETRTVQAVQQRSFQQETCSSQMVKQNIFDQIHKDERMSSASVRSMSGLHKADELPSYQTHLEQLPSQRGQSPDVTLAPAILQRPVTPTIAPNSFEHTKKEPPREVPISRPPPTLPPPVKEPPKPIHFHKEETPITMTFQPVFEDRTMCASPARDRPTTPSLINKPAPIIPYYQMNLVAVEHGATETNLYQPSSPEISRSPTPKRSVSPAPGPPPNPLKSQAPKGKEGTPQRQAHGLLTQATANLRREHEMTQKGFRSGVEVFNASGASNWAQSQQSARKSIGEYSASEMMQKAAKSQTTTQSGNATVQRSKAVFEEYERTQTANVVEYQKSSQCQMAKVGECRRGSTATISTAPQVQSVSRPAASGSAPRQTFPPPAPPAPSALPAHDSPVAGGGGVGGPSLAGRGKAFGVASAPKRGRGVLNKAATPGSRVPLCAHCNGHIRGPFITALGRIWCPEHFICVNSNCRRPLQDIGFVEEQGQLYCEYCFEQFIAPACDKCHSKIKGDCLNAIGKHFHPECFNCAYCGKLFGNNPFFLEEGLPYCEADWNELFTTKCFACGFPVEAGDRWVEALNNNYHSQCFNCTMCKKNLEGQSFYAKGGRPFCKNHAR